MPTDPDEVVLEKIRADIRAINVQTSNSNVVDGESDALMRVDPTETVMGEDETGGNDTGGMSPPVQHPRFPGFETKRLTGKNDSAQNGGGICGQLDSVKVTVAVSVTKQLRLRLTEEFAAVLKQQPTSTRGPLFIAAVFGRIGTTYASGEFFAAVEYLQRISVLLQCALERGVPDDLAIEARKAVRMINHICRKDHVSYVSLRLRLPTEYANALLDLPPRNRERIIRLAVRANDVSFPLQQLVFEVSMINVLIKRFLMKLNLSPEESAESEVRRVLSAFAGLCERGRKGGSK